MSEQQTQRHQLLVTLFEAFNRHDVDGVMACMTDDVVFDTAVGSETVWQPHHRHRRCQGGLREGLGRDAGCELDLYIAQRVRRPRPI